MIICADDFGYTKDINQAVIELARHGCISAVSCMMGTPASDAAALHTLRGVAPDIDIGLHLAFTIDAKPLSAFGSMRTLTGADGRFHPFAKLLWSALLGNIEPTEASLEMQAQYDRFVDCVGRAPDFVDGHMHVHQFPGLREGLIQCLAHIEPANRPYVRNTAITLSRSIRQGVCVWKTLAIGWYGGTFREAAAKLPTNSEFGGIYDYHRYHNFPSYLRRFTAVMDKENDLLTVHPGLREPWRRMEYETLLRADWLRPRLNRFRNPS